MSKTDRSPSPLLLDTHAWVEVAIGKPMGKKALRLIEEAAGRHALYASVISAWEISMLASKGRLHLSSESGVWCQKSLHRMGATILPLSLAASIASTSLPGAFHGDPADRFLVATARELDYRLVTRDRGILAYGEQGYLQTLKI